MRQSKGQQNTVVESVADSPQQSNGAQNGGGKKTNKRGSALSFLRGSKRLVALSFFALLCAIFCSYLVPQITGLAIDSLIGDTPPTGVRANIIKALGGVDFLKKHMIIIGAVIMGIVTVQVSFAYVRRLSTLTTSIRVTKTIKEDIFTHIQSLPFAWHASVATGDIIQRSTQDADLIGRYMSFQFVEFFRIALLLAVSVPIMLLMNPVMTLVVVVFLPAIAVYSGIIFPKIAKNFKKADEAEGRLTAKLQENLTGIRVVRAFGQQAEETRKFKEENKQYVSLWARLGKMLSVYWATGDFLGGLQFLSVLISGTVLAVRGEITVGTLLIFLTYSQMLIWPMRNIGRILAETGKVKTAFSRIREVLAADPENQNEDGITPAIGGRIEFENVSFSYDEQPVLQGVSFVIEAGQTVGILGGTGSGKSTLAQLVSRLYDPSGGRITLDGIDLRQYNLPHLRKNIGLVLQDTFLFSKTVGDNISIANADAGADEISHFAKVAGVDEDITGFAEGYGTMVGEKGVTLSGGQKQRIAIARTLIGKPPVLIFDDSLSAVDTQTDFLIRNQLKQNLSKVTTVLISHRITTLMDADKILVLDGGRIVDSGTHKQLISRAGIYKNVYGLQSAFLSDSDGVAPLEPSPSVSEAAVVAETQPAIGGKNTREEGGNG